LTTTVLTHPDCLFHDTGPQHPETPARLEKLLERLKEPDFAALKWATAPLAQQGQLTRVHSSDHVRRITDAIPQSGRVDFEPSGTVMSPESLNAALRGAGAVCAAVDAVLRGETDNAFCAVRPPGHHAEISRTSGFCLFNGIAIGARHAQIAHKLKRIAVVDFDVHHGNGTQNIFENDPDVFFGSVHQAFIFPKTGLAKETGVGNVVNVPMNRNTNGEQFIAALREKIIPAMAKHKPEMIFLSAGFDAHFADPVGDFRLHDSDYRALTEDFVAAANKLCNGRIVSMLEGGYHPAAVASAGAAHVAALMRA